MKKYIRISDSQREENKRKNEAIMNKTFRSTKGRRFRDFLIQVSLLYNNEYDYSKAIYKNSFSYLNIICLLHGVFRLTPNQHLHQQKGCPFCENESKNKFKKFAESILPRPSMKIEEKPIPNKIYFYKQKDKTVRAILRLRMGESDNTFQRTRNWEEILDEIPATDRNEWVIDDFSEKDVFEKYGIRMRTQYGKKKIIRPHLGATALFILKARAIHGDKYDYSKVVYIRRDLDVIIICPTHGEFKQSPSQHLIHGCYYCGINKLNNEQFYTKCNEVHNNKYKYPQPGYDFRTSKTTDKMPIECPVHGLFHQRISSHLNGYGCKDCATEKLNQDRARKKEENKKIKNLKISYKKELNEMIKNLDKEAQKKLIELLRKWLPPAA